MFVSSFVECIASCGNDGPEEKLYDRQNRYIQISPQNKAGES